MMSQRYVHIFGLVIALTLVLTQFQNCAPAPSASQSQSDLSSDVRLIEDLNKAEIQFVASTIEIQDDAVSTNISGLCNRTHNASSLKWAISASQGAAALAGGESVCKSGQFHVNLAQLDQLVCGVSHLLVVEGSWGGSTYASVIRRCEPLASQAVAAPAGSPYGTTCALEYSPNPDAQSHCLQVCYRDHKLVFQAPVATDQCSSLVAGLTGQ